MAIWLAIGPPSNWEIALGNGVWGFPPTYGFLWKKMTNGELLFFHATHPVRGIIGYGKVLSHFIQEKPFWPREVRTGLVEWPLQVKFEEILSIPMDQWVARAIHLGKGIGFQRALQRLDDGRCEKTIQNLQAALNSGEIRQS